MICGGRPASGQGRGGGSETEGQTSTDQASGKQSNTTEQKSQVIRGPEQKSQDIRGTDTEPFAGSPSAPPESVAGRAARATAGVLAKTGCPPRVRSTAGVLTKTGSTKSTAGVLAKTGLRTAGVLTKTGRLPKTAAGVLAKTGPSGVSSTAGVLAKTGGATKSTAGVLTKTGLQVAMSTAGVLAKTGRRARSTAGVLAKTGSPAAGVLAKTGGDAGAKLSRTCFAQAHRPARSGGQAHRRGHRATAKPGMSQRAPHATPEGAADMAAREGALSLRVLSQGGCHARRSGAAVASRPRQLK